MFEDKVENFRFLIIHDQNCHSSVLICILMRLRSIMMVVAINPREYNVKQSNEIEEIEF